MDLSKLIVPSKTVWSEYPGLPGFEVQLAYLTRDELQEMREKCTQVKYNKGREPKEEVDSELFQKLYIKGVIKDWKGLKYTYLSKLAPVDLSSVEDLENGELDFSESNAELLMKNARGFDDWVTDMLEDVGNFS